jgi:hypothetical protein
MTYGKALQGLFAQITSTSRDQRRLRRKRQGMKKVFLRALRDQRLLERKRQGMKKVELVIDHHL